MKLSTKVDMQLQCHNSKFSSVQVPVLIGIHSCDLLVTYFSAVNFKQFAKDKRS